MMETENKPSDPEVLTHPGETSRRDFLGKAGRFAVVTPPTVTFLLTTSADRSVAASPAKGGRGVAGGGGVPGGSGCSGNSLKCFFERLLG